MAEETKTVELISKDGKREWSSSDPVEITNLRAQGWHEKTKEEPHTALADSPAAVPPPANKAVAAKTK